MKIFVTGGSGFLGKRVIKSLIHNGHVVFALARSPTSSKIVENLGATAIVGDLASATNLIDHLKNIEVVVHCAAPVEFWGAWETYQRGIIDATMALVKVCQDCGVRRFIHISSESVLQDKNSLFNVDENFPYPEEPNSFYGKSKKIAEERLLKHPGKMEIVILRPTFIWGPDCPAFSTISNKVKSGEFMWIDQGQSSFEAVHVDNVAEAIRLSITRGSDRSVYLLTDGEDSTVRGFFENIFKALSLKSPRVSLPLWLVKPIAATIEKIWKLLNLSTNPPITRFDLAFIAMPRKYKIDKITRDLNYKPVISRQTGFAELAQIANAAR